MYITTYLYYSHLDATWLSSLRFGCCMKDMKGFSSIPELLDVRVNCLLYSLFQPGRSWSQGWCVGACEANAWRRHGRCNLTARFSGQETDRDRGLGHMLFASNFASKSFHCGVSGFHLNGVPDRWSTWIRWCFTQRLWPSVMRRFKRSALALCWDGIFLSAFTFSHRFVIFCDIILALGSLDFKAHGAGRERGGGLFRYVFAFSVSGKSLWSRWNGETCCSSCWVVTPRNDIWMPWWRLNGWRLGNRIGFLQVER